MYEFFAICNNAGAFLQFSIILNFSGNFPAKLSAFGLAKDGPTEDRSHVSTRVMGTDGYAAPQYLATVSPPAPDDSTVGNPTPSRTISPAQRNVQANPPTEQPNTTKTPPQNAPGHAISPMISHGHLQYKLLLSKDLRM